LSCEELFRGTIDGASVHPREVVKQALARNAAAVILAHNPPRVGRSVEVRVLDHLVIGGETAENFAERGLL
jgi:DNA repair protein RadC